MLNTTTLELIQSKESTGWLQLERIMELQVSKVLIRSPAVAEIADRTARMTYRLAIYSYGGGVV